MYQGMHFKSSGIGILHLVKSKLRCISLWEHAKYIYIISGTYVHFSCSQRLIHLNFDITISRIRDSGESRNR